MRRSPLTLLAVAPLAGLVAACGQGPATVSSTASAIPAGCTPPSSYQFTGGAAHIDVTGGSRAGLSTTMSGLVSQEYGPARANQRYAATQFNGQPWLNLNFGNQAWAVYVEMFGISPCSSSLDSYHNDVDVLFSRQSTDRYGGPCHLSVAAFNDNGIRGSFTCADLKQFGIPSNRAAIQVHGTFAATGHVVT